VPDGGAAASHGSRGGAPGQRARGQDDGGGGAWEDRQQRSGQCGLPVHAAGEEGHQPGRHGRLGGM